MIIYICVPVATKVLLILISDYRLGDGPIFKERFIELTSL